MAKEIKAIQCPKCGSTRKTEIKTDFYRCTSCDTEYYLDNDDIVITHNVHHNIPANKPAPHPVSAKQSARIVLFLCLVIPAIFFLFRRVSSSSRSAAATEQEKAAPEFRWWDSDRVAYAGPMQQPVLVFMGQRDYMGSEQETQNGKYIAFYDLLSGKELKVQRLGGMDKETSGSFVFRTFENGDLYAIFNKTRVFKINKEVMIAEEVSKTLFNNVPQLASGVANAEFVYENYGDGFTVMTNEGSSYHYYPTVHKIFTADELYNTRKRLEIKDPAAATKTYYAFVSRANFPNEKKQLIKYTQRDNAGGPKDDPYFIMITGDKDKTKLKFQWGEDLVLSFSVLTPDGGYFEPKILHHGAAVALFQSNTTAAKEAPTSLQCLDVNTGTTIFTLPFTERKYFDEAVRYKDGFIVKSNDAMFLVAKKGNLIKEYKTL